MPVMLLSTTITSGTPTGIRKNSTATTISPPITLPKRRSDNDIVRLTYPIRSSGNKGEAKFLRKPTTPFTYNPKAKLAISEMTANATGVLMSLVGVTIIGMMPSKLATAIKSRPSRKQR